MRALAFGVGLLGLVVAGPAFAGGSWPTYGHDFQRTARADGAGDMHAPTVAWTKRLGGLLTDHQFLAADVDGDGQKDLVSITGGRAIATKADGTSLWQGQLVGARAVLGAWDLDGNGQVELVVDTPGSVQVLDGKTGSLIVALSTTGPVDATFVPEPPRGGFLILATARGPASGYDFRNGPTASSAWTFTSANQTAYLVGDVDGDGAPDLVRPLEDGFEVDNPLNGQPKYSLPAMGPAAYFYTYQLANVDGVPGDEIIAIDTSYFYSPSAGIYVLGVRNNALTKLWSNTVDATLALSTDYYTVAGSAVDLDNNGAVEIVYSQWDDISQTWTTKVVDGATGTPLSTTAGQLLQGVADIDGDGHTEVITRSGVLGNRTPIRSLLSAYDFDSPQSGLVAKNWNIDHAHVLTLPTSATSTNSAALERPISADFDSSSGTEILVLRDATSAGRDTEVDTLRGNGTVAASWAIPADTAASVLWEGDALSGLQSLADVAMFTNDGEMHVLSHTLSSVATVTAGTYSNWTYAPAIDSSTVRVFAATSNQQLLWMDGTILSSGEPKVLFTESHLIDTTSAAAGSYPQDPIVLLPGTAPSLVGFEQDNATVTLVGHDQVGIERWRTSLAPGSTIGSPGAMVTDLTGDGVPDLLLNVADIHAVESLAIFDGYDGHLVRSTPLATISPGGEGLLTGSLVDVNADGHLDLVAPLHSAGLIAIDLSTSPMSGLWTLSFGSSNDFINGTVGVAPLSTNAPSEIFRASGNNGFGEYLRVSLNGTEQANANEGLPHAHGYDRNSVALVRSQNNSALYDAVMAGTADVGLSRVRRIAGDTLAPLWTVYLANGAVSTTAPASGYALHDPMEVDVDGDGTDDVVVGSDDGYLYALHAADGAVLFTVDLGAPVMHVIAANVDLDPAVELVASLADGRLVALDDHYTANTDPGDAGADATADGGSAGDAGCPVPPTNGCTCETALGAGGSQAPLAALLTCASLVALVQRRRRP